MDERTSSVPSGAATLMSETASASSPATSNEMTFNRLVTLENNVDTLIPSNAQ
jgi:hypothetical protein